MTAVWKEILPLQSVSYGYISKLMLKITVFKTVFYTQNLHITPTPYIYATNIFPVFLHMPMVYTL
jgi:hypothetical protein